MINDIYNTKILEYAGNITCVGRLENPDATAKVHSKLCGSTVVADICARKEGDDWIVTDFAHEVKACALGQASSAMMALCVKGSSASELEALRTTMIAMLKENGPPPEGKFAIFRFLEPVRDYKARHASTLLSFDAVVDCLGKIKTEYAAKKNKQEKVLKSASDTLKAAGIGFRVR